MSQVLINQYLAQLDVLKKVGGTHRESVVREAFKDLLKGWGKQHDLVFIPEYKLDSATKDTRYVDGALLHELRVPFGYWEAKDAKDDLDAEIEFKFKRGYPQDNIIFEDSTRAVLIQHREEVMRCDVADVQALEKLLRLFFSFERAEIADFRQAVAQFKIDLPAVLEALRSMIEHEHGSNAAFTQASQKFLKHAQDAINPSLTEADVREMLIQHILTEEIFSKVFDSEFHRDNNVARELYKLEATFFTGGLKKSTLKGLEAYYAAIRAAAAQIGNHHEKQTFLKVIYENFYKVYNAKAADRLGVVYTPNEIVRFMIEGADWLCEKHFQRNLIDKDVEILDPATGTGTFICELLEHFRGQPKKLAHKYKEELHANEVAILPYYVANLNIEATYAAITGEYAEFQNLCFVDTLDNVGLHTQAHGVTANKNREYPEVDARIKQTYIAESTAQKTKLYDMYARFFRWASDRLDANGVLAFVTNRSFVESRTFDGFRKVVAQEFAELYVVDLGGDVRANPKLSGTKHNVFGIQTGVAISFLVKRKGSKGGRVFYARRPEMETAEEKLAFLGSSRLSEQALDEIRPDAKQNWLHLTSNNFDTLMPLAARSVKATKVKSQEIAIVKLFSLGVATNRDEWVYGFDLAPLCDRVRFLIDTYNGDVERVGTFGATKAVVDSLDYSIKWTRSVKRDLGAGRRYAFNSAQVVRANYRPFVSMWLYRDRNLNEMLNLTEALFRAGTEANPSITVMGDSSGKPYFSFAIDRIPDLNFVGPASGGSQTMSLWRFEKDGTRIDNITDWSLAEFRKHYQPGRGKKAQPITKEAIFHYVYAVLHDPQYRETYAQNLKREFPRIPLYGDSEGSFWQWAAWGEALMALHIGYEQVTPFALVRTDVPDEKVRAAGQPPKVILKADKDAGRIALDSETTLTGVPKEAWAYVLGNRCAIDWVLDQYKEKKPKDPTIRARFDTYRFANHKEQVIDLLRRVTTVSVETVRIVGAMKGAGR